MIGCSGQISEWTRECAATADLGSQLSADAQVLLFYLEANPLAARLAESFVDAHEPLVLIGALVTLAHRFAAWKGALAASTTGPRATAIGVVARSGAARPTLTGFSRYVSRHCQHDQSRCQYECST
jgi:hypothetical protein